MLRWQKVRVFVSSPFTDMHAERDYLVKRVFPELRAWCEARRIWLVDVDLRWGISEQDIVRNRNVVKVCLDRIDECRPFFIAFLGQRRGWVPSPADLSPETWEEFPALAPFRGKSSVTEMEILHALRRAPAEAPEPAAQAFFYLRDPGCLEQLPEDPSELRRLYVDEGGGNEGGGELERWRSRVIPGLGRPVHSYEARWDPALSTPEVRIPLRCPSRTPEGIERWRRQWAAAGIAVRGLAVEGPDVEAAERFNRRLTAGRLTGFSCRGRPLAETLLADLQAAITEVHPDRETTGEERPDEERDQQELFLFRNTEGFTARGDEFSELDAYLADGEGAPLFLAGASGTGKSMLLANWIESLRARGGPGLHFRFIGASDDTTSVSSLLRSLGREIREAASLQEDLPTDPFKLGPAFAALLRSAGRLRQTVVVLDALDQLESGLDDLDWLPLRLPPGLRLVASFKRGPREAEELWDRLAQNGGVRRVEIRPWSNLDDRRRLVRSYARGYLKDFDEEILEALVRSEGAGNPLFLKIVLSELRLRGSPGDLHEEIRQAFGATPASAFDRVLRRLEEDRVFTALAPQRAVPLLFGFLAHARRGLSISEMARLLDDHYPWPDGDGPQAPGRQEACRDAVNLHLRQLRPFLAQRQGRVDFLYESFRQAAADRYAGSGGPLPEARPAGEWHRLLAGHFRALANPQPDHPWRRASARPLNELAHHLLAGGDLPRLAALYADAGYLEALCRSRRGRSGRTLEHVGLFDLLANLQEAERQLGALSAPAAAELRRQLDGIHDLIATRNRLLLRYPRLLSQELASYLDPEAGEVARALRERAAARARPGLLVLARRGAGSPAPGHDAAVRALAASPREGCFLSGSVDGSVGYWNRDLDRPLWKMAAHRGRVTWVDFSASGARALSTAEDGSLFVWDVDLARHREVPLEWSRRIGWLYATCALFLDEETVLVGLGSGLRKIHLASGEELWSQKEMLSGISIGEESRIATVLSHRLVATGDAYRQVRVCDAGRGDVIARFQSPGAPEHVALSADGRRLLVADAQGRFTSFDPCERAPLGTVAARAAAVLCRAAEGASFWALTRHGEPLRIAAAGAPVIETAGPPLPEPLRSTRPRSMISLPGGELVVGLDSGTLACIDPQRGEAIRLWPAGTTFSLGAVPPGGSEAVAVGGILRAGEARDGGEVVFVGPAGQVARPASSPHGHLVTGAAAVGDGLSLTVDQGGTAVFWRNARAEQVVRVPGASFTACAAWREAGLGVAGTGDDRLVFLRPGGPFRIRKLPSNDFSPGDSGRPGISALAAAGDPLQVFALYFSGEVRYSGTWSWGMNPHSLMGTAAALDPRLEWAAGGDVEGRLRLWRCRDGALAMSLPLHQGAVLALGFSEDGTILYSAGADGCLYGVDTARRGVVLATMLDNPAVALAPEPGALAAIDTRGISYRLSARAPGGDG